MDVLIDLLPSVNQVKIGSSKKDKRQRNKYSRQMNSSHVVHDATDSSDGCDNIVTLKQVFWSGPERRSSENRRQLKSKRGRWLESRDKNDRRAVECAISVKI